VPQLGQLLLEEKRLTPAQLEEALETQVIHGGRLGTNLVELGFVPEAEVARVLGRQQNMPYASGEMVPDPAALAVAPVAFYDDNDVMPMRVDATRLTVVVTDSKRLEALDALAFKAGKRLVQVLVPEFRMNQLLRKHAKAFRPMRPIDMNTLRPSKRKADEQRKPADVSDLINEDDFAKLYAAAASGEGADVIEGQVIEEAAPITADLAPVAPAPTPLTFVQAQQALQTSQGRDDIAHVVLRFAISKFRRALLLSVQGDLLSGWRGLGQGVTDRTVLKIGVSLREANSFKLVRDLRSHFVGPMKQTSGMDVFYKILGKGYPSTAVVMPLLVRSKPVHLLYVDNGPGQLTPPDVGELLIVSQSVSRSYEALIRQRKMVAMAPKL
jgi:hypothetical protein